MKSELGVGSAFLSPDGQTMLVPKGLGPAQLSYSLHLLDATSGRQIRSMDTSDPSRKGLFQGFLRLATASPDGRTWAVPTDGTEGSLPFRAVVLLDALTGQQRGLLWSPSAGRMGAPP